MVPLKLAELVSIVLTALVVGVFWGPWLGLSRSIAAFTPEMFLAIGHRMIRNIGPVMRLLMPAAVASFLPVLFLSFQSPSPTFYFVAAGLGLFVVALGVTLFVEVPIDKQISTWTADTLPAHWQALRDRWETFHVLRLIASLGGFVLLVVGVVV